MFLACWLLCIPRSSGQTAAESYNPHLEEAKELYLRLQYAEVVHKLELALTVPGNTKRQLCEIYKLMGAIHVVLENEEAARNAFKELLNIDPGYSLDAGESPKILKVFSSVKDAFVPTFKIAFRGRPDVISEQGKPPRVEATVDDPAKALAGMDLYVQGRGEKEYVKRNMYLVGPGRYRGTLALGYGEETPEGLRLEYYIQARGVGGVVLATMGSPDNPYIYEILAISSREKPNPAEDLERVEQSDRWYETWWFWTAVGIVSVGIGVGVGVGLTGNGDLPASTLGRMQLE